MKNFDHKYFISSVIFVTIIGFIVSMFVDNFNWAGWTTGGVGGSFLMALIKSKRNK